MNRWTTILLTLLASLTLLAAADPKEEFRELNNSRNLRSELVKFLKGSGKLRETADGTLISTVEGDPAVESAMVAENRDRLRQFEILADSEDRDSATVAKEFAVRMGGSGVAAPPVRVLTFNGSNTIGASLAPELVRAWLEYRGAVEITHQREGTETAFTYRDHPRDAQWKSIVLAAHGSSTAFTADETYPETGLAGGFCDIGMSSRPIKSNEIDIIAASGKGRLEMANTEFPVAVDGVAIIRHPDVPVTKLTLAQVTAIFSGGATRWSEFGGPDQPIRVYSRDFHSGTYDSFNEKVLKPADVKLREDAQLFEDSGELVRSVAADPLGIGFVGLAYVNSTVAQVAVQAAADTRPLMATRLTIKTLDFPLSRLLYLYAPLKRSKAASDFLDFAMSDRGQEAVDRTGLIGQGKPIATDIAEVDGYKESLLADPAVPSDYKELIRNADRRDSMANIRFASGRTEPDVNSQANLQRLAGALAELATPVEVLCIGFTDSRGSVKANMTTSAERSRAAAGFLTTLGVTNVTAHGFGEAMPVADNDNEPGRAANRRVEIWIRR